MAAAKKATGKLIIKDKTLNNYKETIMRNINDYTTTYKQSDFESIQVKYRRKKVLEQINKFESKRILEIGCGLEPLFSFYDKFEKYIIVEPSKEFYENAVKLAKSDNRIKCFKDYFGKDFIQNKYDDLKSLKFDLIVCSSLLHEIEDVTSFLESLKKICSKDTVVHINVPNSRSLHRLLAKHIGLIKDEHQMSERNILLQQQRVFDLDSLSKVLNEAGFKILDKGSYFIKPFTHAQMEKLIESGICDDKMLDGFFSLVDDLPEYGSEIYANCKIL
ncbi:MAG: class I SAM-dependent methyltransferase [Candidatus Riflebacteria bacterium]|nr:class I SAM-dependent methyltransferase [Candidatus Riflebacteria bacterium]